MKNLAAFVKAKVPRLLPYAFFLNEDQTQMTVIAVHPDSSSLEYHLDKGSAEFRKFAHLLDLLSIEIYGQVSDSVIDRLNEKAKMLSSGTLTVQEFYAGFTRQF